MLIFETPIFRNYDTYLAQLDIYGKMTTTNGRGGFFIMKKGICLSAVCPGFCRILIIFMKITFQGQNCSLEW